MPNLDFDFQYYINQIYNFNDDIKNIFNDDTFYRIDNVYIGKVINNELDKQLYCIGCITVYIHKLCSNLSDGILVKPLLGNIITIPQVNDYVVVLRLSFDNDFYYIPFNIFISDEKTINNIYNNLDFGKDVVEQNFNRIYYFGNSTFTKYLQIYDNPNIQLNGLVLKTQKHNLIFDDKNELMRYKFANNLFVVNTNNASFTLNKVSIETNDTTLKLYGNLEVTGDIIFNDGKNITETLKKIVDDTDKTLSSTNSINLTSNTVTINGNTQEIKQQDNINLNTNTLNSNTQSVSFTTNTFQIKQTNSVGISSDTINLSSENYNQQQYCIYIDTQEYSLKVNKFSVYSNDNNYKFMLTTNKSSDDINEYQIVRKKDLNEFVNSLKSILTVLVDDSNLPDETKTQLLNTINNLVVQVDSKLYLL